MVHRGQVPPSSRPLPDRWRALFPRIGQTLAESGPNGLVRSYLLLPPTHPITISRLPGEGDAIRADIDLQSTSGDLAVGHALLFAHRYRAESRPQISGPRHLRQAQ